MSLGTKSGSSLDSPFQIRRPKPNPFAFAATSPVDAYGFFSAPGSAMDEIAARAETSKRSLYAHHANKEQLFLAVIGLVRELFLSRLKLPGDYASDPETAVIKFCSRFLEILLYSKTIQMCRLSMAEATRFLKAQYGLSAKASSDLAQDIIARVTHPRFSRALFGLEALSDHLEDTIRPGFDIKPVKKAVTDALKTLEP